MSLYLRIIHGAGVGQVLPVPAGQPVTLGRSGSASYAFDDPLLSRKHCAVESRGDQCRIVDLQSRNGTYVNGQRVGAVLLKLGDRIKIGNIVFEVCPAGPMQLPPGVPTGPHMTAPLSQTQLGQTIAAPQGQRLCQGCSRPLGPQGGRELKGRLLCAACLDRFDVDEDLIDGFKLLERIEVNSFGATYVAQQKLMGRNVVVKTISVTGEEEAQRAMRRFLREAKAGGRLSHQGIVELYDVNEQAGLMYIVTEHVEGDNLEKLLRERNGAPLPGLQVTRAMLQIAEALQYAHEQQIVHRDVKPGNVLIRRQDGRAKLQGFNLAKNLERAGYSVITADGETLGTPYYMSPEQVRSAKNVDPRSDIYSWAATFYHCVSGKLPLEARSYGEFIEKVFNEEPPPLDKHVPSAPRPLVDLLARCLAREPDKRPATMAAVVAELEPILRALEQR